MPIDTDIDNLKGLSDAAGTLSTKLIELQAEIGHGTITLAELKTAQKEISTTENEQPKHAWRELQAIENEFPETPTLIYDGPLLQAS